MDTFGFPYHSVTHIYPKGDGVRFGRGYIFTTKPQLPFQRIFRLHFNAMQWLFNGSGVADATINPSLNILALINFYEAHDTSQAFIYAHPVFGNLVVKFSPDTPLEVPKAIDGGTGTTEAFELFLVEQPGL
jgi:hypothetical protein